MKEKVSLQKRIYPELNLEKWSIWLPTSSRTKPKVKILERSKKLPNGNETMTKVEVGFTHKGVLTTDDQKVYYALIKMWEEDGRPSILYFSLQRLARVLNKPWSGRIAKSLSKSLERLQATPFTWVDSYYDSTTNQTLRVVESFNILANLRIVEKDVHGHTTKQDWCCKFNDLIDKNLRNNHTKPLLFETLIQFSSGITQLLYKFVDLVMADKTHYERRTELLFEDLGLEGQDYKKVSVRKRILEKACKDLNGCPMSTGFLKVTIKQAEDGKDYKVVFDKVAKPKTINVEAVQTKPEETKKAPAQPRSKPKIVTSSTPQELVKYFYKLFHNLDTSAPTDKEIGQSANLINGYGFDLAKYTIEFSHTAATKTNYQPQTFGGILQYAPKAAAEFVKKQKEQMQQQAQQQGQTQLEQEAREKLAAQLRATLAERFTVVEQQATQQLLKESPFLQGMQQTTLFKDYLYPLMLHIIRQENTPA